MRKLGDAAHRLVVRAAVNAAELVEIKENAARFGLTVSAFVRSAALCRLGRQVPLIAAADRISALNRRCGEIAARSPASVQQEMSALQSELADIFYLVSRR